MPSESLLFSRDVPQTIRNAILEELDFFDEVVPERWQKVLQLGLIKYYLALKAKGQTNNTLNNNILKILRGEKDQAA